MNYLNCVFRWIQRFEKNAGRTDHGPTDGPTNGRLERRTVGTTDGRNNGRSERRTDRTTKAPNDERTDGRTDRPSYKDAWVHLKTNHLLVMILCPFCSRFWSFDQTSCRSTHFFSVSTRFISTLGSDCWKIKHIAKHTLSLRFGWKKFQSQKCFENLRLICRFV